MTTTAPVPPERPLTRTGAGTSHITGRARSADLQSDLVALPAQEGPDPDPLATVRELPLAGASLAEVIAALDSRYDPALAESLPASPFTDALHQRRGVSVAASGWRLRDVVRAVLTSPCGSAGADPSSGTADVHAAVRWAGR